MSFILRDYQRDRLAAVRTSLRSHRQTLLQSPTGSGKTVICTFMVSESANRGLRSWIIVHRRELLDQTSAALWKFGVRHGCITAGKTQTNDLVQVCTVQTLARRMKKLDPPDFLIIDEAHHTAAKTYRTVLDACPKAFVVGLTATPVRTDGAGLDDLFSDMVPGPAVSWLIEQGYLAPYRLVAPPTAFNLAGVHTRGGDYVRGELAEAVDKSAVVGDAVEHYKRFVLEPSKREGFIPSCLVYCVSRAHARHVEEAYRAAGIDARYCAGDTEDSLRRRIVDGIGKGIPPVIVSVDLFGEGLDVPGLRAVQLLRPTQSLSLHLQQVGRALRMEPGKTAIILDHVGNSWNHGLPDDDREWSLEGTRKTKRGGTGEAPSLRHCDGCFSIFSAALRACPQCGKEIAPGTRAAMPDHIEGELVEVDPVQHRRERAREEAIAADSMGLAGLVAIAKQRGYKAAWAGIRWATRTRRDRATCIKEAHRIWRDGVA